MKFLISKEAYAARNTVKPKNSKSTTKLGEHIFQQVSKNISYRQVMLSMRNFKVMKASLLIVHYPHISDFCLGNITFMYNVQQSMLNHLCFKKKAKSNLKTE